MTPVVLALGFIITLGFLNCVHGSEEISEAQLILFKQDGHKTDIFGPDCPAGIYFPKESTYSCACVTGVWAFYDKWCKTPISIVAGSNHCFKLDDTRLKQVSLLSSTNTTFGATIVRMTNGNEQMLEKYDHEAIVNWDPDASSFVVIGDSSWTLETATGKSYCLLQTDPHKVCFASLFDANTIRKVQLGCNAGAQVVEPSSCILIENKGESLGDSVCTGEMFDDDSELIGEYEYKFSDKFWRQKALLEKSRVKRQAGGTGTGATDPGATQPGGTGTGATDPGATQPGGTGTGATDPGATQPGGTGTGATQPGGTGTGATQPGGSGTGGTVDPNTQAANDAAATEDEDYVDPAQSTVKNNPIILDQLKNYLDGSINDVTGASPYTTSNRFPVFDLLDLTSKVMASTCAIVSADHFKMSVNTFINIQTHSLQVKEPYVPEPTFKRIKDALNECLLAASAYNFVYDDPAPPAPGAAAPPTPAQPAIICEGDIPTNATHSVMRDDAVMNISMPVVNAGAGYEPIIESIWKTFLNAHSYCYSKFSEYYNDHHSFTVALLHFFTNDIQSMWFPVAQNGTYEEPAAGGLLYGGLIGNHKNLMENIDLCVAASRIGSPYPWLMTRPPKDDTNKWSRRRKRSTLVSHGEVCLTSPTDIYTKVNHPTCK